MSESLESHWHLDKRIPIALLFGLLAQVFVFGWFMAALNARVEANVVAISLHNGRLAAVEARQTASDTQNARLEERLAGLSNQLSRIEALLERRAP